jgi:hypothetical protein
LASRTVPEPLPPTDPPSPPPDDGKATVAPTGDRPPRAATFGQTLSAVLWSFFGVRKGKDMRNDAVSINPVHLILVGLGVAALIVVGLLLLVRMIVH